MNWKNGCTKEHRNWLLRNNDLKREITERKRVELALSESEDRYRTLFETSPDAVMLVDKETKIIFANQRAASMHGYQNPNSLSGMKISKLIAPKDMNVWIECILRTIEQGTLREIEYQILMKDGSQFPAELNVSIVRSDMDLQLDFCWIFGTLPIANGRKNYCDLPLLITGD